MCVVFEIEIYIFRRFTLLTYTVLSLRTKIFYITKQRRVIRKPVTVIAMLLRNTVVTK